VLSARDQIAKAAETQLQALLQRTATVRRDDRLLWQVTPLRGDDSARIQAIARGASLRPLEPDVHRALTRLATDVGVAVDDFRKVRGFGRLLAFGKRRQRANQAAQFLADYHHWFLASGVRSALEAAMPADDPRISSLSVVDALADWVGFKQHLAQQGRGASIVDSRSVAALPNAWAAVETALRVEATWRKCALDAGNNVRRVETERMLAEMPVERLREATRDRIRTSALVDNGIRTVGAVLANEHWLDTLAGIGEVTATRIRGELSPA